MLAAVSLAKTASDPSTATLQVRCVAEGVFRPSVDAHQRGGNGHLTVADARRKDWSVPSAINE